MESSTQASSMLVDPRETQTSGPISPWCRSRQKRWFDLGASCCLLVAASPIMLVAALLVRASSRGPVLFRQFRVGHGGKNFTLLKFRTMADRRPEPGLAVTRRNDPRVTFVGRFLRKFKLDELPQLVNIVRGEMSLVGPRPDVPGYYALLAPELRTVLLVRPGATGAATLRFRNEEGLLAQVPQDELLSFYTGTLLPKKIGMDLEYARRATFYTDLGLLLRTLTAIFVRDRSREEL